jgi:hypothetical protein
MTEGPAANGTPPAFADEERARGREVLGGLGEPERRA